MADGERGIAVDNDGVIVGWGSSLEDRVGYTPADAIGQSVELIVPPALRSRHWAGFEKAIANGQTRRTRPFNTLALHKSGKLVPLRASLRVTHREDGSVSGAEAEIIGPGPAWLAVVGRPVLALLGRRTSAPEAS